MTPHYRRRVKRAIQALQNYLLMTRGSTRVSADQRRAVHYLLDTITPDSDRRARDTRVVKKEEMGLGSP